MSSIYTKLFGLLFMSVVVFQLVSCSSDQVECTNSRGFKDGLFQQTWFIKPERKSEYIGAIFGDKTGELRLSGKRLFGDYCIEDKTIYFEINGLVDDLLVIEILRIDAETMVLQMEDGNKVKYYNPYPDLTKEIDLEPNQIQ